MHAVYLLSDLLAGKLIPLLTCGKLNPMEIPCKSPEAAYWDTDRNAVRWQHQLLPHPGNQGAAVKGVQGKRESFNSAAQLFARVLFWLCLCFSLAY